MSALGARRVPDYELIRRVACHLLSAPKSSATAPQSAEDIAKNVQALKMRLRSGGSAKKAEEGEAGVKVSLTFVRQQRKPSLRSVELELTSSACLIAPSL